MSTPAFPYKLPLTGHVLKSYAVLFKSTAISLTRTSNDLKGVAPAPASEWQGVAADRFNAMVIQTMAASATIADILLQTAELFDQSAAKVDGMSTQLKAVVIKIAFANKRAADASGVALMLARAEIAANEKQLAMIHADFMKLDTELRARFHTAVAALQEAEKMLPFRPVRIPPTGVTPKKTPSNPVKPDQVDPGSGVVPPSNGGSKPSTGPSSRTVVAGDSWWAIAEGELSRRGLPVTGPAVNAYMHEMETANQAAVGRTLLPGAVLALPVPAAAVQTVPGPAAAPPVTPAPSAPHSAPPVTPAPRAPHSAPREPRPGTEPSQLLRPLPATPSDNTFTFDSLLLFRK
jgi:uncharacterized protein YukE